MQIFQKTPSILLKSQTRTSSTTIIDPDLLLRLTTVLYQQQHASDSKLHSHLRSLPLPLPIPHELIFQLCSRFPLSWRPLHRFLLWSSFSHSPSTFSRTLSVFGASKNMDLLWSSFTSSVLARPDLLTASSLLTVLRSLASSREISKCVRVFDSILKPHFPPLHSIHTLNLAVESLSNRNLVREANDLVSKLRPSIPPDGDTYGILILGFCKIGDLITATKLWNRALEESFEPPIEAYEEIIVTLFKTNRADDALRMFAALRARRFSEARADSYRVVIQWMCKRGRVRCAHMVFDEMLKRGLWLQTDNETVGALVYGLVVRSRVREAYRVVVMVENPEIGLYHGLMKGLLRLKRAGEATEVFREMIRRGVEPIMHTYVMLLQGHLGRRGRKGKDGMVNFESVFVGGLVKQGRMVEVSKFVERTMWGGVEVPRFDYNKFLHWFSNEEGVEMFESVGRRMKEVGMVDLGDVFLRYGEKMATRDRRRRLRIEEDKL